jgi:hypothetical protein
MSTAVSEFPPLEFEDVPDDVENEKPTRTRRTRKPRAEGDAATRKPRQSSIDKLSAELLEPWALFSKSVAMISPTGGAVCIASGEDVTKALCQVAAKHPKMLAALRNISQVSPMAELAQFAAVLILAIGVDVGKVDPDAPLSRILGISDIYHQMADAMGAPSPDYNPGPGGEFEFLKPPPSFPGESFNADGTYSAPGMFAAGPGAGVMNG